MAEAAQPFGPVGRLPAQRVRPETDTGVQAVRPDGVGGPPHQVAGIHDLIAKGENKVSFHLADGMQVDVRLLPSESYGAALQYFTGSKAHNVSLRQRALKMGCTLSEWSLARLDDNSIVAAATEEEISFCGKTQGGTTFALS